MLKIYNTLSRKKEIFVPINDNNVGIYVCGMTVYDYCHIGHARVMVVFDMITRYLRYSNYNVKYVRNITDIDDKIINKSNENNEDFNDLVDRYILSMKEDEKALLCLPPDIEPKVTQHIDKIMSMIEKLIDKGYAYISQSGDVLYDISKFKDYGKLSGEKILKDNDDFVLWKLAKPNEPSWESP